MRRRGGTLGLVLQPSYEIQEAYYFFLLWVMKIHDFIWHLLFVFFNIVFGPSVLFRSYLVIFLCKYRQSDRCHGYVKPSFESVGKLDQLKLSNSSPLALGGVYLSDKVSHLNVRPPLIHSKKWVIIPCSQYGECKY